VVVLICISDDAVVKIALPLESGHHGTAGLPGDGSCVRSDGWSIMIRRWTRRMRGGGASLGRCRLGYGGRADPRRSTRFRAPTITRAPTCIVTCVRSVDRIIVRFYIAWVHIILRLDRHLPMHMVYFAS